MLELLRKKKSLRILIVAGAAIAALAGAVYLYFHNPDYSKTHPKTVHAKENNWRVPRRIPDSKTLSKNKKHTAADLDRSRSRYSGAGGSNTVITGL